jgi:hypothetical protein
VSRTREGIQWDINCGLIAEAAIQSAIDRGVYEEAEVQRVTCSRTLTAFYYFVKETLFLDVPEQIETYASKVADAGNEAKMESRRRCIAADYAVMSFLPKALEARGTGPVDRLWWGFKRDFLTPMAGYAHRLKWADLCTSAAEIVDRKSARAAAALAETISRSMGPFSTWPPAALAAEAANCVFDSAFGLRGGVGTCAGKVAALAAQDRSFRAPAGQFGVQVEDVRESALNCLDDLVHGRHTYLPRT